MATACSGVWSIPLTLLGTSLLYGAEEMLQSTSNVVRHLSVDGLCEAIKESVHQIQSNHMHVHRMMPNGGLFYGSNVLPIDRLQDNFHRNNPRDV